MKKEAESDSVNHYVHYNNAYLLYILFLLFDPIESFLIINDTL